jgi:hypothetical protein
VDLVFGDEHVYSTLVEVYADPVSIAKDSKIAVLCCFWARVEDAWRA